MTGTDIDEKIDTLEEALVREALRQKWQNKYAKFGKQSQTLFVHSLNAFSVARDLGRYLFELPDSDLYLVSLTAFFHDYQKGEDSWQQAALDFMAGHRPEDRLFKHDSGSVEMRAKLEELLSTVGDEVSNDLTTLVDRILNMIVYTHDSENTADTSRRKREVGPIDPLTKIIRLSDSIASIKDPQDIMKRQNDPDLPVDKKVKFEYHELSAVRGVVSSFLNEAIVSLMEEAGYSPLLYFGNGAIYILVGESKSIENPRKRIQELIEAEFKEFQESDVYNTGISNAVIGPLTQTKWPCLHLVREKDIAPLIRYIVSMPATNKKESFGDSYYDEQIKKKQGDEYRKAMDDFITLTKSSSKSIILAEMISDFNILVYVFDFIKNYRDYITEEKIHEKYDQDVNTWLAEYLGEFTFESISDVSNTSPVPVRITNVSLLWKLGSEDIHKLANRRKRIRDGCISLLKRVVNAYGKYSPPLIEDKVLNNLLSEIRHLPRQLPMDKETKKIGKSIYETYSLGKTDKKRLCNLCSLTGEEDATAGLIGDGSEKFTNFLPGGMKLGAGKKAKVCFLCLLEATLRAFYFPSTPHGTMFILPDMSLSPSVSKIWMKTVDELVRVEHLGMGIGKSWNMLEVYKTIAQGEIPDTAETLTRSLRPTNNELKEMVSYLSDRRETPDDIDFEKMDDDDFDATFEEIANAHIKGKIKIDQYLMEEFSPKSKVQRTSLFTPSYAITFLRNPLKDDKDEAPSTSALRTYLLSSILSEVFHARVLFVEGYQPIEQFDLVGRIDVQIPAPAENALRNLGIAAKVKTHEITQVLKTLTSLVLISMSFVKKLGKDRLLRLASMNRGAILRRAQMEVEKKNWDKSKYALLGLLDNMPAKAGKL